MQLFFSFRSVGQRISTKIPDGEPFNSVLGVGCEKVREDVTDLYKCGEGTRGDICISMCTLFILVQPLESTE